MYASISSHRCPTPNLHRVLDRPDASARSLFLPPREVSQPSSLLKTAS
jgi:hypothetical protein